ncbi:MAG: hypothetical protein H7834_08720 [Magnetococcus sp. YQC-9]
MIRLDSRPFWRYVVIGWCMTLAACASLDPLTEKSTSVSGEVVTERFQNDQALRAQGLKHWSVEGSLEIETPEQGRRNRIDLLGSGQSRVRMRIHGPFRQIAAEMIAFEQRVRWVDSEQRTVTEVPATPEGLHYLIGVPIDPERLVFWLMGQADALTMADILPHDPEGVRVETRGGERLWLDEGSGRIRARAGEAAPGSLYRAIYDWPDPKEHRATAQLMPKSIHVTLDQPKIRMVFTLRGWRLPSAGPVMADFDQAVASGFSLFRPLAP